MAISTNYPAPVWVNGFQCKNCTDVDNAKQFIDPDNTKAGPFGMNDPQASAKTGAGQHAGAGQTTQGHAALQIIAATNVFSVQRGIYA